MKHVLVVLATSWGLLAAQPVAFAETYTLPGRADEASGSVTIAPHVLQQLSAEQQQLVQRRLTEVRAPEAPPAAAPPSGDLSDFERMLAQRQYDPISTRLKQYGYDLFNETPSTFAPVDDLPVPDDYVVGPGDEIMVSAVSPRRNAENTLTVARDGTIFYPNIGTLTVAGMSYARLVSFLGQQIKGEASQMQLTVRMGKLRSIKVFVVGRVKKPGAYTVSSLSSLSNALLSCGGPTKAGSLRDIQLKRHGKTVARFDYYDLLMQGDSSKDLRLQAGDVIFIPPTGPQVAVAGNVKSPAIYELKGTSTLADVLQLAGGIAPTGYTQQVQIERFDENRARKVLDVNIDRLQTAGTMTLQDGDLLKVFPVSAKLRNAVFLEGNVERPGQYEFRPNLRLRDVIRSDRDLKPESYMELGMIERVTPPDDHIELIPFHLGKALAGDATENKRLSPEDRIRIYYRWDIQELPKVRVAGAVNRGGEFQLRPRMTVSDLIHLAGGLLDQADLSKAELTRVRIIDNKAVSQRLEVDLQRALRGEKGANVALEKGDYLLIRPVADYKRFRTVTLMGEIAQPGVYTFRDGETLTDVIQRAGGYTARAYLKGAIFTRQSVKRLQEERLQEFADRLSENLYRQSAQQAATALSSDAARSNSEAMSARRALVESLKQTKASGRMIVALDKLNQKPHSTLDVQLEEGDTLVVPSLINSVSVLGQVYNPTAVTFEPGRTLGDYLAKTGGTTQSADQGSIYVVRADGSVLTDQNVGGWWPFRRGIRGAVLEPGDTVMVPERLAVDTSIRDIRDITQILFQIATTAALTWSIVTK